MSTAPTSIAPTGGNAPKKSTAVGPRDGKKAFERVTSILGKLDPDVMALTLKAVNDWSALQINLENANVPASH